MAEFRCRVGECVKCCTHETLGIHVTLPDLYRFCVYAKVAEGRNVTMSQICEELCDGWIHEEYPVGSKSYVHYPKSKIPCPNVDMAKNACRVHDTRQYAMCKQYPECMLVSLPAGHRDNPLTVQFYNSLECMKGVSLTPERKKIVIELTAHVGNELVLTEKILNGAQGIRGKNSNEIEAELMRRLSFYDQPEFLDTLVRNMNMHRIQQDYMRLFDVKWPDYTVNLAQNHKPRKEFEMFTRRGLTIAKQQGLRPGRNDPCPCGSHVKFKKCCGRS